MKRSAGILAYRRRNGVELFLVHPGGPFWRNKEEGAWSIPKGEIEPDEEPLAAARREFREETGHTIDGTFTALDPVKLTSGKRIVAWAIERDDLDPAAITSIDFEIEWPPRSGQRQAFPEVDRAAWFSGPEAVARITPGQVSFVIQLLQRLGEPIPPVPTPPAPRARARSGTTARRTAASTRAR